MKVEIIIFFITAVLNFISLSALTYDFTCSTTWRYLVYLVYFSGLFYFISSP